MGDFFRGKGTIEKAKCFKCFKGGLNHYLLLLNPQGFGTPLHSKDLQLCGALGHVGQVRVFLWKETKIQTGAQGQDRCSLSGFDDLSGSCFGARLGVRDASYLRGRNAPGDLLAGWVTGSWRRYTLQKSYSNSQGFLGPTKTSLTFTTTTF